jgi:hypothetical protein
MSDVFENIFSVNGLLNLHAARVFHAEDDMHVRAAGASVLPRFVKHATAIASEGLLGTDIVNTISYRENLFAVIVR